MISIGFKYKCLCIGVVLVKIYKLIEFVVLAVLFFGIVTPVSMLFRFMGLDLLNLKLHRAQKSYWVKRQVKQLSANSFYSQFIKK